MKKFLYAYRYYIVAAVILGMVFGSMYGLVQQLGRMQANDTPSLLATQAAKVVNAYGVQGVTAQPTDIANNPVPFVIIYDKNGKAVAGSGYLNKKLAVIPKNVLTVANSGMHTVTWEPKDGVRIATVIVSTKNNYVLGGQSLKYTESHADKLFWLALAGYGATLVVLALSGFLVETKLRKPGKS